MKYLSLYKIYKQLLLIKQKSLSALLIANDLLLLCEPDFSGKLFALNAVRKVMVFINNLKNEP